MARPQILPNLDEIIELRDQGLTQREIADKVNERNKSIMGRDYRPITRGAVSAALSRAGELGGVKPRYEDEIPWSPIRSEHAGDYRQSQLRTWAKYNRGVTPTARQQAEFASFKAKLEENDAVIHYDPDMGFVAVKRRPGVDTGLIRLTDKQIVERGLEPALNKLGLKLK